MSDIELGIFRGSGLSGIGFALPLLFGANIRLSGPILNVSPSAIFISSSII